MLKIKFLIPIVMVVIFNNTAKGKTYVTIQKAINSHFVSAKAMCNGGLELTLFVNNLVKDSIFINVPAGWRFNSDGGKNDYQDILITRQQIFALHAKEKKKIIIAGFCCEATKAGPVEKTPYTLGTLADSGLVTLARYLAFESVDDNTAQYAVWAVSDNKSTANIAGKNDSVAKLVRSFVAGLKGEPLPWYTLVKRASVSATGCVNDLPVKFKAVINYSVTENCYSYCYIIDKNGLKVSEIFGKWLLPQNNTYDAVFNIAGLKKGQYKLVLENKEAALFERNFDI